MTKLTDIPGASEALPHSTKQLYGYDGRLNSGEKYIIERIDTVHLEVDVKSLDKIIIEYCNVNSLLYDGTLNLSRHLSDTIPKWARLVRK